MPGPIGLVVFRSPSTHVEREESIRCHVVLRVMPKTGGATRRTKRVPLVGSHR